MKDTKTTSLGYTGRVTIGYEKNGKIYKKVTCHNEGLAELFKYIANCIAGNYNQSLMPQYLHTFTLTYGEMTTAKDPADESKRQNLWATDKSTCPINIKFSTVQVRANTNAGTEVYKPYITEFTFMIPHSQLQPRTIDKQSGSGTEDVAANVLCLYNTSSWGSNVKPLAYITLENDPIKLNKSDTSNLVVTWEMAVSNS